MLDIVVPRNNEIQLIRMAEVLGYDELILLYDFERDISSFQKETRIRLKQAIIINNTKQKLSSKNINILQSNQNNRFFLDSKKIFGIYNLENQKKEYLHFRNSGLNQVFCEILRKNDVKLILNFNLILNSSIQKRYEVMGRMAQNIRFSRKFKYDVIICSFARNSDEMRSQNDLKGFFRVLGLQ